MTDQAIDELTHHVQELNLVGPQVPLPPLPPLPPVPVPVPAPVPQVPPVQTLGQAQRAKAASRREGDFSCRCLDLRCTRVFNAKRKLNKHLMKTGHRVKKNKIKNEFHACKAAMDSFPADAVPLDVRAAYDVALDRYTMLEKLFAVI